MISMLKAIRAGKTLCGLCFALFFLVACKPSVPSEYLQPDEMTDILYDYHLASSMAELSANDSANTQQYRAAVLKKHEVTQQQFEASLAYYMRHTEQLKAIYEQLNERFTNEASALGASGISGDNNQFSANGDTANVWHGDAGYVLSLQKPFQLYSFAQQADSSFHKGDVLMLNFDANFIFQDGNRDGVAMLSVQFANDSIASQVVHITTANHYSLMLRDDARLGIKAVRGFLMLSQGQAEGESETTMRMMFITRISLLRMHTKAQPAAAPADSIANRRDSVVPPPQPTPPLPMPTR